MNPLKEVLPVRHPAAIRAPKRFLGIVDIRKDHIQETPIMPSKAQIGGRATLRELETISLIAECNCRGNLEFCSCYNFILHEFIEIGKQCTIPGNSNN
jgi:hypothetical protein